MRHTEMCLKKYRLDGEHDVLKTIWQGHDELMVSSERRRKELRVRTGTISTIKFPSVRIYDATYVLTLQPQEPQSASNNSTEEKSSNQVFITIGGLIKEQRHLILAFKRY